MKSNESTSGRVLVVVTGAGRGFGRTLVDAATAHSCDVLAICRSEVSWAEEYSGVSVRIADCSSEASIDKSWDEIESLVGPAPRVALINNAGYYVKKPFLDTEVSEIERTVGSNVFPATKITRRLLGIGNVSDVVNVVSSSALKYSVPHSDLRYKAMYAGSKAALSYIAESMIDVLPSSIRCINLYPRNINTWSEDEEPDSMNPRELADWLMSQLLSSRRWHLTGCVLLPIR